MSESAPGEMTARSVSGRAVQGGFPRHWHATILNQRPLILPRRRFVYPREAEDIERGALELLVKPDGGESFLATCALGFADPLAPSGIWSCPNPTRLCAIAGGYAYLIDTTNPERFEHVAYRPVLAVQPAPAAGLLLFIGNQAILAYNKHGRAWESPRLSDEGITILSTTETYLHGIGWHLATDREEPFTLALRDGSLVEAQASVPESS